MPDAHRPYRAWGYPLVPALYIAASLTVIGVKVFEVFSERNDSWYPLLGLLVLAVAFTAHQAWALWAKKRRRRILVGAVLVFLGASLIVDQVAQGAGG